MNAPPRPPRFPSSGGVRRGSAALPIVLTLLGAGSILAGLGVTAAHGLVQSGRGAETSVSVAAQEETVRVYGPVTFAIPSGTSALHVEAFDVTPPPGARYRVVVVNGDGDGGSDVDAARVEIDGTEVVSDAQSLPSGETSVDLFGLGSSGVASGGKSDKSKKTEKSKKSNKSEKSKKSKKSKKSDDGEQSGGELIVELTGPAGSYVTLNVYQLGTPETTVFGPVELVRTTGAPNEGSWSFDVPAGVTGPFGLHVNSGLADGSARATSASVELNGVELFGPDDFTPDVGSLETGVTLLDAANTLNLTIAGKPGSRIEVSVTGLVSDVEPPVVTISAPDASLITSEDVVTVLGTVVDASAVTVTVNGVAAHVVDNATFSATVPLAGEGATVLSVIATDAFDNVGTATVTVTRDTSPPTLTVSAPADGLVTGESPIDVTGTALDAAAATVVANGVTFATDAAGAFAGALDLVAGMNVITVTATDPAGNQSVEVRTVTLDSDAPVLVLTTPTDDLVTSAAALVISGTVTDATTVTVVANGVALPVDGAGAFTGSVPLVAGANVITVTATDQAGNASELARTVTLDADAPVLVLTMPTDDLVTSAAALVISGTVTDATTVTVVANGVALPVDGAGAFTGSVPLVDGANVITVTATDEAGNATELARTVTRDSDAPVLVLATPTDDLVTSADALVINGTVTDATTVTVEANGVALPVDGAGAFTGSVPLVSGANVITVTATDEAGNVSELARTVTRDSDAPVLDVTSPTADEVVGLDEVAVAGTVTDASAVTVTANGVDLPVDEAGAFEGVVPLAEGVQPLTVTATDAAGNTSEVTRTVTIDLTPPTLTLTAPGDGLLTDEATVSVSGTTTDATAVSVVANGVDLLVDGAGGFSGTVPLVEGANTVTVTATDAAGNETEATRAVTLDSAPPVLSVVTPVDGLTTDESTVSVTGSVTDVSPVVVDANGVPLPVDGAGSFSGDITLAEGANIVTVTATDAATNSIQSVRIVTLDTQPPVLIVTAPADGTTTTDDGVDVAGTVTDATAVTLTLNGAAVAVDGAGAFTTRAALGVGANTLVLQATDEAGNSASESLTVTRDEPIPPDPSTVAPAVDPTVTTNIAASTAFLYSGPSPIQTGVAPGTIEPRRVGVLRGKVLDRASAPLSGVRVTVPKRPEFGQTLTRADGGYDLAVNGGGNITLSFSREGYFSAQRKVEVPWQDYHVLDDVVLVEPDPVVTTIDFSAPIQVAQGSVVTDVAGSRQATLLFKAGTQATMVMPDGTRTPLSSISVRATEYTVGPDGPKAMPGKLPVATAYTYAVELSADEAIAAGAGLVEFDRPQAVYVENFHGLEVGHAMPVGVYDPTEETWVGQPDGIILRVVGVTGGVAELDVDGDGVAESEAALQASLGIDAAELATVGSLYAPGQSLWRVQVSHFSSYDFNIGGLVRGACVVLGHCAPDPPELVFPGGTPAGSPSGDPSDVDGDGRPDADPSTIPGAEENELDCDPGVGSFVVCTNQTLGESLPITGTPFSLDYLSSRVPGWAAERRFSVPIRVPADDPPLSVIVETRVAGRLFTDTLDAVDQDYDFEWDGRDAYGRLLLGKHRIEVRLGFVYELVGWSSTPLEALIPGWASPSPFTYTTVFFNGQKVPLFSEPTVGMVGQPAAVTTGGGDLQLGGWTLSCAPRIRPGGRRPVPRQRPTPRPRRRRALHLPVRRQRRLGPDRYRERWPASAGEPARADRQHAGRGRRIALPRRLLRARP